RRTPARSCCNPAEVSFALAAHDLWKARGTFHNEIPSSGCLAAGDGLNYFACNFRCTALVKCLVKPSDFSASHLLKAARFGTPLSVLEETTAGLHEPLASTAEDPRVLGPLHGTGQRSTRSSMRVPTRWRGLLGFALGCALLATGRVGQAQEGDEPEVETNKTLPGSERPKGLGLSPEAPPTPPPPGGRAPSFGAPSVDDEWTLQIRGRVAGWLAAGIGREPENAPPEYEG